MLPFLFSFIPAFVRLVDFFAKKGLTFWLQRSIVYKVRFSQNVEKIALLENQSIHRKGGTSMVETRELFDLSHSIAGEYLGEFRYPWQALAGIGELITKLGPSLPPERFEQRGEDIWVARSAQVAPTAHISGPCIIDEDAEVRHGAFIRGKAIVGKKAVVGNSTELKNVVLFDNVQVPHYNYVGDSILGYKAHMGAGSITSNVKSDKQPVVIRLPDRVIETGLKKCGAMLGDGVEIGCNSVLNPGTVIGQDSTVYPTSSVRQVIPAHHIYKDKDQIVAKRSEA